MFLLRHPHSVSMSTLQQGCTNPRRHLPGRLNFVQWRPALVGHQCGTCSSDGSGAWNFETTPRFSEHFCNLARRPIPVQKLPLKKNKVQNINNMSMMAFTVWITVQPEFRMLHQCYSKGFRKYSKILFINCSDNCILLLLILLFISLLLLWHSNLAFSYHLIKFSIITAWRFAG